MVDVAAVEVAAAVVLVSTGVAGEMSRAMMTVRVRWT
jgi:hypothetical protein